MTPPERCGECYSRIDSDHRLFGCRRTPAASAPKPRRAPREGWGAGRAEYLESVKAPCGTREAYKRHIRNGEAPDDACRAANAEYSRKQKASQVKFRVYLAGPINGCTDDEAFRWRHDVRRIATQLGQLEIVDPADRDERGREDSEYMDIVNGDKAEIDSCSAVLANCWKTSVGTSMEIMYAYERRKSIVVCVPVGRPVSPWYRAHAGKISHDPRTAIYLIHNWALAVR